jgi:hypothetical protein
VTWRPAARGADEAAALVGPDTIDCIAPADRWEAHWTEAATAKRAGAGWLAGARAGEETGAAPDAAPMRGVAAASV